MTRRAGSGCVPHLSGTDIGLCAIFDTGVHSRSIRHGPDQSRVQEDQLHSYCRVSELDCDSRQGTTYPLEAMTNDQTRWWDRWRRMGTR